MFTRKKNSKDNVPHVEFQPEEWTLVQYVDDSIYYICPSKTIKDKTIGKICMVKWKDRKFYKAKIMKNGNKENLKKYLNTIIKNATVDLVEKAPGSKAVINSGIDDHDASDIDCKKTTIASNECVMLEKASTTDSIESESAIHKGIDEYGESNIYFGQIVEQNNDLTLNKISNTDAVETTRAVLPGIDDHDASNIDCKKTTIEPNECVMLEKASTTDSIESESAIQKGIDEYDARNIDLKKTTEQNEFVMLEKNSNAHSVETKSVIFSGSDDKLNCENIKCDYDYQIEMANEIMSKILTELNSSKSTSEGFSDIRQLDSDATSEIIEKIPDIDLNAFDTSTTSEECYNSPEYNPYADNVEKYSDISDEDSHENLTMSTNNLITTPQTIEKCPEKSDLQVQRVLKNPTNPKTIIKNKKVYCIYCENLVTNFPRHLERKHALEIDLRAFILMPKKSKERVNFLELLKNKGNLHYNRSVLEQKSGSIIVGRRPKSNEELTINDFLPCKYCFKFMKKKKLYRHIKRCKFYKEEETGLPKRRNNIMQSAILLQTKNDFQNLQTEVFSTMKYDDISMTAKNDHLICSFGARLLQNHKEKHLRSYISQRMRQLAKMLLILQSLVPDVYQLNEFLVPQYFKTFVEAAKRLSGYDEDKNTYINPSNALKIGHSILQCCDIFESQSIIESKSEEKLQTLRNFKKIFQMEWKYAVSSNAIQDMNKKKFNKTIRLPNADDIQLLHNYLSNEMIKGKNVIEKGLYTKDTYKTVCQCLLSQIILLNRRRSGEVERIKVTDYLDRDKNKMQNEILQSLTEVEARLSKNFVRFVIRGKKGRGVPVLLTPILQDTLDVLINIRSSVDVLESNPYIFAIPFTVEGTYRGTDCLRKCADACGASDPDQLRSTKLRKHIATMSQLINLSNNDREQLANFMGHDLAIHNEYYRLPDETLQISRVSKILLAMESGKLHELKGKSLEEFDEFMPANLSDTELDEDTVTAENIIENSSEEIITQKTKNTKKRGDYQRWTNAEMQAIKRQLSQFISLKKIPQQHDCLLAIKKEPALRNRNWQKIKFQVANIIKKDFK